MIYTRLYSLQDRHGWEGYPDGLHWYRCNISGESLEEIAARIELVDSEQPDDCQTEAYFLMGEGMDYKPYFSELKKWTQDGREARIKSFDQTHAIVENVLAVVGKTGEERCPFFSNMELNLPYSHCLLDEDQDRSWRQRIVIIESHIVMGLNNETNLVAYTMRVRKGEVFACGDDRYVVTADNRLLCNPSKNIVFEYPLVNEMRGKCFQDYDELYQFMDSMSCFSRHIEYVDGKNVMNIQYSYSGVWKPFPVNCMREYFTGISCSSF